MTDRFLQRCRSDEPNLKLHEGFTEQPPLTLQRGDERRHIAIVGRARSLGRDVVADDVSYGTPQTSYYAINISCPVAVSPSRPQRAPGEPTQRRARPLDWSPLVNLPHGATMTNVRFIYVDNARST